MQYMLCMRCILSAYSLFTLWHIASQTGVPFNFKDMKAIDKYCLAEPHKLSVVFSVFSKMTSLAVVSHLVALN